MTSEELLEKYKKMEGNTMTFVIERATIEKGKSFSHEALDALFREIKTFIGARMLRRWDDTKEPPSVAAIHIQMDVH